MMVIDFDPSRKPDLAAADGHELGGSVRRRQRLRSARVALEAALQMSAVEWKAGVQKDPASRRRMERS